MSNTALKFVEVPRFISKVIPVREAFDLVESAALISSTEAVQVYQLNNGDVLVMPVVGDCVVLSDAPRQTSAAA